MKFMTMVTTTNPGDIGAPPAELMQAIGELGQKAGAKLKDTGGMKSIGLGKVEAGTVAVDGPFAEAKEAIGGFALYELDSEAEAVEWVTEFLELHRKHWPVWEGEVQLLQLISFGPPPIEADAAPMACLTS
jgi:hypothetical protein